MNGLPNANRKKARSRSTYDNRLYGCRDADNRDDAVDTGSQSAPPFVYTTLTPPIKWHGGKHYLARRIIALMPRHIHYCEPYAGGLGVLLARDPADPRLWWGDDGSHRGVSEIANDLDGRIVNFWRVLQDPGTFKRFRRRVEAIPLSRAEWEAAHAHEYGQDPVADAVAFFVCCRQSWSGRMTTFPCLTKSRTRRAMNGNASEWLSAVDGLADVHARLRRVVLDCRPALEVIEREDTPGTLFYCDPPYPHATRTTTDAVVVCVAHLERPVGLPHPVAPCRPRPAEQRHRAVRGGGVAAAVWGCCLPVTATPGW
jgi:DNA adenine methylase